jgi:hypothetical protein
MTWFYTSNTKKKNSTQRLLDTIHSFSKVGGYKVNFQKSVAFLYTKKEQIEKDDSKIIPLKIASRQSARGSKIATRVQKQTAWVPWIKNLAETLEPHLAEIKHHGESKLQHPEPLVHRKFLHITLHWKNRWATTSSKPASKTFSRPNRWAPSIMWYSPNHSQDKVA